MMGKGADDTPDHLDATRNRLAEEGREGGLITDRDAGCPSSQHNVSEVVRPRCPAADCSTERWRAVTRLLQDSHGERSTAYTQLWSLL